MGALVGALAPVLAELAGPLADIGHILGGAFAEGFAVLTPAAASLAAVLGPLARDIFAELAPLVGIAYQAFADLARIMAGQLVQSGPAMVDAFAAVSAVLAELLPLLVPFAEFLITDLLPAIGGLVKAVGEGLAEAWRIFSDQFGGTDKTLAAIGNVLGVIGKVVTDYVIPALSWLARNVLPHVGTALALIIGAIKVLAIGFTYLAEYGIRGFRLLLQVVLRALGLILDAATFAFGWIPGIGDDLKDANAAFDAFSAGVVNDLEKAADKARAMRADIRALGQEATRQTENVRALVRSMRDYEAAKANTLADQAANPAFTDRGDRGDRDDRDRNGRNRKAGAGRDDRPMINIERLAPHNYGEFHREVAQRTRQRSLTGEGALAS